MIKWSFVEKDRVNHERKRECYEKNKKHLTDIEMSLTVTAYTY